ncbi:unnamed protein product [Oikopleura dioica]|uniref:Uncharacterized protein n=1 Tax=Oikopleura dioica TaxID=34765 RepID=E4WTY8_OIKDI|nr:unnamed protein product [Oikopleura dioica]
MTSVKDNSELPAENCCARDKTDPLLRKLFYERRLFNKFKKEKI